MERWSRRRFLGAGVAAGLGALGLDRSPTRAFAAGRGGRKPDILFILTDQQTAGAMSACGNPYVRTPAMDRIAASGVRFAKAYCAAPVCGPSRASLLTSRMPHETGVVFNGDAIRPEIPAMGKVFRAAGYRTVWVGKWHLPESYPRGTRRVRGFEYIPIEARRFHLGAETDGPTADACVGFLRSRPKRPFLLVASFLNPHDICGWVGRRPVPHPHVGTYPPLPANFAVDPEEPTFLARCRRRTYYGPENIHTKGWDGKQWRAYLRAYYRFTEAVDGAIGRVVAALREVGREESTLIVFTSDHGEGVAAHHWVVKLCLYEEPVTVPLIVSWKGVTPGGAVDRTHLASGLDVLPTLCDYAGVEPPEGVRGRSLRPWIEHPGAPGRAFVVSEVAPDTKDPGFQGRMLRTARFKYIAYSWGERREQLFDLEDDPGEVRNLARDRDAAAALGRHRRLLAAWCARTGDAFRVPGA